MISLSVMAHPTRKRYVQKLVPRLDQKPRVVWDERNDVWDTGRRALLAHGDEPWHLVLQDDAVVPKHLIEGVRQILSHTPTDVPVSLYMGRWRHRPVTFSMRPIRDAAEATGASFLAAPGPWWGVGIILPTADIEEVVAFGDNATHQNYDIRIAQFYDDKGIDCWYTLPSVIDHQQGPSLIGRRGTRRHALYRMDGPMLAQDWSGPVLTPADLNLTQPFPVTP